MKPVMGEHMGLYRCHTMNKEMPRIGWRGQDDSISYSTQFILICSQSTPIVQSSFGYHLFALSSIGILFLLFVSLADVLDLRGWRIV